MDSQVKVNGCRVELGEIEAAFHRHPQVREVYADLRGDDADRSRIVVFAVTHETGPHVASALRRHARKELPRYMAPAQIHLLRALPKLTSGKVDRVALRQWSSRPKPKLAEILDRLERSPDSAEVQRQFDALVESA